MTFGKIVEPVEFDTSRQVVTQQNLVSPVNLNSIISALLLYSENSVVDLDKLHSDVRIVYGYLELRSHVKLVMNSQ